MGWLGDFFSGVCSCISSVCRAIGGALSSAAAAIGGFVEKLNTVVQIAFPGVNLLNAIGLICNVIGKIAEFLGLKTDNQDSPEELGMKAEQADKKPEDFENTEKYINYLHNEIELDKKKMESLKPDEKSAYAAIGSYVYLKGSSEKLGVEMNSLADPQLLCDFVKLGISDKEIVAYISNLRDANIAPNEMSNYLHGAMPNLDMAKKIHNNMISTINELKPVLTKQEAAEELLQMREKVSNQ